KHFEGLKKQGEETPLDHIPDLDNETEMWYFKCYKNLKSLTGFEYHLTITDFKHYFDIYPVPFCKTTVISVIKNIDKKIAHYHKEVEKAKKKIDVTQNTNVK
ncbi:MAG: hypothetical protein GY829_08730, partial [Gammaproteobacteria bacterium]|nr:hypothetical protein [Gammaproteobacteria bacterium]